MSKATAASALKGPGRREAREPHETCLRFGGYGKARVLGPRLHAKQRELPAQDCRQRYSAKLANTRLGLSKETMAAK